MPSDRRRRFIQIALPIVIIIIGILVAVFIDTIGVQALSQMKFVFTFLFYIYVISACVVVFFEEKSPDKMISWLLVLILFPGVGLAAYLAFGRSFRKKYRVKPKKLGLYSDVFDESTQVTSYEDLVDDEVLPICKMLIKLLQNNSNARLLVYNEVKIMPDGGITFANMIEELKKAKQIINFEFFIVKDDILGNKIKDILIEKALGGVEVNFLYDAVGSWRLSNDYKDQLINAGVNVRAFLPVIVPFISRNMNYRNHRKILTVDGQIGFMGGLNIGDEYVGNKEKFGYWRDTHMMFKGESVYALNNIFLDDWRFSGGQVDDLKRHYPKLETKHQALMQIASSGPDSERHVIMQAYFKMIAMAKKNIFIETPYLVPEESLLVAIKTAALSGVDVRIVIPYIADHFMVYWANQSNIEDLLKAGVKIYYYKGGFIHSKSLLVDDVCASVGTANLDIRSMELNFEVNAFIYNKEVIKDLRNDFEEDLYRSELIKLEDFENRKAYRKVLEAFGRMVSPLQ